jgi:hypothetical protein
MKWILAVVATEAIVEILLHSELLDKPRQYLMNHSWFFQKVLSCGWCLSAWIGAAMFAVIMLGWQIILVPIAIHRGSNFLHLIYSWINKNRWRA